MIIDLILDRREDEKYGIPYDAAMFYRDAMHYGKISHGITAAMDYGEEEDVRRELCKYIIANEYNPEICAYVNARNWLE